ncbi:uncharacterized protein EDB91DRAFT_1251223 [Suillus paluster]|uniref:uncharacterized protein n=1 Tax=Suillus paluster TaxID=48578 RepID=UPI001B86EA77|nr:uncharacterized protein EDB91DRAFT_1251223 [Suillus paluster]KAG1733919.1 hypothetical protein EDB91DRAFT_1251223 [Suillus paluster]
MVEPIRRTRAKNATAHPGQIVLDAQQKCQTPKVKAADEKRLQAAQEAKEALAVAGLNRLAELQANMEEAQATTTKPKAVRPRPLPKKQRGTASASNEDESAVVSGITTRAQLPVGEAMEDADEDLLAGDDDSGDDGRKKKERKNARSLSNAIVKARKNLPSTAKADSCYQPRVNEKGNSLPAKSTLGGRIQNWRKDVYYEPTTTSNSLTSASQVPPSTIFSKSQISHDSTGTSLSSNPCEPRLPSSKNLPKMPELTHLDELVGGFGDEDLDDSFEHAVALHNHGKVSTIEITSHDTDPDLVPPPLAQRQSQDDLLTLQEEIDDIVYEPASDDEEAMQVDEIEDVVKKPIAVKTQQANTVKVSRTTATTSVGTVSRCDNKVPPSKKAKTTHVKSEHSVSTAGPKGDGNWVELVSKAHSTYLNTDLPPGCHEDGKWARQFLPTVFLWLGAQDELWAITDAKLLHACQEIFKVIYPNIRYKVVTSGSVTQRVSEWRSNFGSTALAMVIDFLNSNRDTSPQTLAKLFLNEFAFLYPDPENIDKAETFRSAFVQELLTTAHLARIVGHADVPTLDTDALADSGITGSPWILEHAFTLVADNTIVVDNPEAPVAGRKARLKTPKSFNKVTGKETATEHAFSIAKWGPKTASFI